MEYLISYILYLISYILYDRQSYRIGHHGFSVAIGDDAAELTAVIRLGDARQGQCGRIEPPGRPVALGAFRCHW